MRGCRVQIDFSHGDSPGSRPAPIRDIVCCAVQTPQVSLNATKLKSGIRITKGYKRVRHISAYRYGVDTRYMTALACFCSRTRAHRRYSANNLTRLLLPSTECAFCPCIKLIAAYTRRFRVQTLSQVETSGQPSVNHIKPCCQSLVSPAQHMIYVKALIPA
jgi:hypothetical protein